MRELPTNLGSIHPASMDDGEPHIVRTGKAVKAHRDEATDWILEPKVGDDTNAMRRGVDTLRDSTRTHPR